MRFTRLRLNGFKSFVDPTDLVIAEGLTGVVGPNGCGKSNLLEALRWVMGENRPTAMRGDGMEDVIFAGASSRPARNFAEVVLMLDNSDRLAPSGFNDSDHLEITRRITRDAGSAYKVNTKDVRARDVQMLFADASTGAHSPALVRQGQIAELINARPTARRRILEEAAGISGLYQRRHEAELKLKGAETNLERVSDVIEQMASQLVQLARQARQAVRFREIGSELRRAEGMLLFRRWKEAADALLSADELLRARLAAAGAAERTALESGRVRAEADEALPPLREEEAIAAAILQRLLVQRDTLAEQEQTAARAIETLGARVLQLGNDISREEALNADADQTIARLEAEADGLATEAEGHEDRLSALAEEAREAAAVAQSREEALNALNEDAARLSARHQSANRLVEDCRSSVERLKISAAAAREATVAARDRLATLETEVTRSAGELTEATGNAQALEAALAEADEARAETQSREADARAARSEAEGELNALKAETAALSRLVERETAETGQVMDLLKVEPGFEGALGAALADDLRAPVLGAADKTGWFELAAYASPQPLPAGARPLAEVVTVPGVLGRRIAQVGLVEAARGAALQPDLLPGQRLVSREGDLWRWDGFRAAAADAPSAAALRLQQLNRLRELKKDFSEATARAQGAAQAHEVLTARLAALTEADRRAREMRRDADRAQAEAHRAAARAESERNIAASRLDSLNQDAAFQADEGRLAATRLAEAEKALGGLGDLGAAREAVEAMKLVVEAARITMLTKRSSHDELRRSGEAREKRRAEIAREVSSWRERRKNAAERTGELRSRLEASQGELDLARQMPGMLAARRAELAAALETAEARRRAAADALALGDEAQRRALAAEREAERAASDAREARAAAEARAEAARETVNMAAERIRDEQDCTPESLLEQLALDPARMPGADAIETDVNRLKRLRESLGAVNLRAEEDARELQAEHDLLVSEKADLEEAIRKLRSGIASLNREGRERLLTAFEQVNTNFATLFTHLFGGGEARLELVESDDPLEAGLEIMCQPPGKKLASLSLLSGGEQTLTALALIFAVFLANPAPICVLDEVDAPLDDANVTRFCDLLDEMTRRTDTRFLIITHHAVTMARMDRLFGVTMGEKGVSQLVSVDLGRAEALVA